MCSKEDECRSYKEHQIKEQYSRYTKFKHLASPPRVHHNKSRDHKIIVNMFSETKFTIEHDTKIFKLMYTRQSDTIKCIIIIKGLLFF